MGGLLLGHLPFWTEHVFSLDCFSIVCVFGIYWTVLDLVASDYQFQFLDSGKSQGILQLLISDSALDLSLAKNFLILREIVKEY